MDEKINGSEMMIKPECWISTKHPELNAGECLLGNSVRAQLYSEPISHYGLPQQTPEQSYNSIRFKSKRKGHVAYDVNGNICKHLYPIIVNIDEYEAYLIEGGYLHKCRQSTIDDHAQGE